MNFIKTILHQNLRFPFLLQKKVTQTKSFIYEINNLFWKSNQKIKFVVRHIT